MEKRGVRFYLVRVMRSGLPAEKAGIKIDDRIVVCNGAPLSDVRPSGRPNVCTKSARGRHYSLTSDELTAQ